MKTTCKVRLTNTFHKTSVNVVGKLVDDGQCYDRMGRLVVGSVWVRLTDSQRRRAMRLLCGVQGCRCDRHGPNFQLEGDPHYKPTCLVVGEKA